jgi:hypothetical protein
MHPFTRNARKSRRSATLAIEFDRLIADLRRQRAIIEQALADLEALR